MELYTLHKSLADARGRWLLRLQPSPITVEFQKKKEKIIVIEQGGKKRKRERRSCKT